MVGQSTYPGVRMTTRRTEMLVAVETVAEHAAMTQLKLTLCRNKKRPPFVFFGIFQSEIGRFYNFWCTHMANTLTISAVLLV